MAPDRKLITAAAAKKADVLSSLEDDDINALIVAASDAVSQYCRIHSVGGEPATFARQSVTESIIIPAATFAPTVRKLILDLTPSTVTAITINAVDFDIAEVMLSSSGALTFLPNASRRFWPYDQLIEITYDAGYVTPVQTAAEDTPTGPDLPADIERAVIITTQNIYAQQSREQFDVAASVEEDSDAGRIETRYFNASRGAGLPGDARALLSPYRGLI